ncbi:MAG: hypothetical protein H6832_09920 [Planctomycetes bacterium]|nr:hypothetical protein [Planctomycetota bacterium]MCB9891851.1 hypothetical protein [Planctomycetota bacterium]MCB9918707.1 hypothetical protein [Planctomycetota bacterium]
MDKKRDVILVVPHETLTCIEPGFTIQHGDSRTEFRGDGTVVHDTTLLERKSEEQAKTIAALGVELELHRARLDATTRAMLAVEAADDDPECTLVNRRDLDTALGVARRNREDLELGDDI